MPSAVVFEPEFVDRLKVLFEERIAFAKLLGLEVTRIAPERVEARIDMRAELIGSFLHKRLHGGVISATLDSMGGLASMAAIGARHIEESIDERMKRFINLGTIDLRVDYLRPAVGPWFTATGEVLRLGRRVASTRMEFFDSHERLVSCASAAFIVS